VADGLIDSKVQTDFPIVLGITAILKVQTAIRINKVVSSSVSRQVGIRLFGRPLKYPLIYKINFEIECL
jgi:5,10-methylenetetrahydrofolate reductase